MFADCAGIPASTFRVLREFIELFKLELMNGFVAVCDEEAQYTEHKSIFQIDD